MNDVLKKALLDAGADIVGFSDAITGKEWSRSNTSVELVR